MAIISIDGKAYEVKEGENLLKTCLGLGLDLPYFCWHPALHSVGACRQCAVKQFRDERDELGAIVMACMTRVTNGMRISVNDPEARKFRSSVIEWMMTNHPHDCPVCDEGGECHLQDMTVMTGHDYRRYRFKKRTYVNQDLGPFVAHEMNRCIACYRCARFYRDYAGGRDFGVFASHNSVYFGRAENGPLESPFSGNLVEVCPTGVFTDKVQAEHYSRPWDLQTAPSVCVLCSLGCNTIPGERYGRLRRIRNRYNGEVNGYFLCDRGRYGYEFVGSDKRIREPGFRMTRQAGLKPLRPEEAVGHVAALLASSRHIIGIGSPRASLEANYALRALVGKERFFSGVSRFSHSLTALAIDIMGKGPALIPTLADVARCDAVLVLGEDITNTAPMLTLNVLQSLRRPSIEKAARSGIPYWDDRAVRASTVGEKGPLFVASTGATFLDAYATEKLQGVPADLARCAFAMARVIDNEAPPVENLAEETLPLLDRMARALMEAERPLVITGVNASSQSLMRGAANIAWSLRSRGRQAYLSCVFPECNSVGLGLLAPRDLDEAFEEASHEKADVAIVLENDLYRRAPLSRVDAFFGDVRNVVVIDHLFHRTSVKADGVLPAATFAEGEGTLVSNEGRAQRYFQVFAAAENIAASWQWLRDIMRAQGRRKADGWTLVDHVIESMAEEIPVFRPVSGAAPGAAFRVAGMKIARQHQRASGRTAVHADRSVHEPAPPLDPGSPFVFSMEGFGGEPPSPLIPRFWAPGWNSVQSVNKFQAEIGGGLHHGDPGVRLVEPPTEGQPHYFDEIPEPFAPRDDMFLLVSIHHVFGSEELSALTPAIQERSPAPYLALSGQDMKRLGLEEGERATLFVDGTGYELPVRLSPGFTPRVAGVLSGAQESPVLALPAWAWVRKARP